MTPSQPPRDHDDDIILLTDVVEPEETATAPRPGPAPKQADEVFVINVEDAPDDKKAATEHLPDSKKVQSTALASSVAEQVSEAQIEAALERVITRLYGEKIERVLHEVAHKRITQDMERIKNLILEEPPLDS
mgnify:FL=1